MRALVKRRERVGLVTRHIYKFEKLAEAEPYIRGHELPEFIVTLPDAFDPEGSGRSLTLPYGVLGL